ncbi:hypothetical protein QE152_g7920 [Popillia japonica]|uniref:Uncharacterized protein n=1 Tax=Popillia japonica TaxID=7064 RepID=A0AAW1MDP4_POPJA
MHVHRDIFKISEALCKIQLNLLWKNPSAAVRCWVFWPIKTYFPQECDVFMGNNSGKSIGDKNIGQIFCQTYLKAATISTANKTFRKCGVEPYDSSIFNDEDFAVAKTTNREYISELHAPCLDNTGRYESSEDDLLLSDYMGKVPVHPPTLPCQLIDPQDYGSSERN